jgi:hypothetical protein
MIQIEPAYVSFEQAWKLKDKGLNFWCKYRYTDFNGRIQLEENASEIFPYAPEQHQVVEWLITNHGIWIYTYPVAPFVIDGEDYPKIVWVSKICSLNQVNFEKFIDADNGLAVNHHRSPQEAYSAAFDYILQNN